MNLLENNNRDWVRKITRYGEELSGTPAFWGRKRRQLIAMIKQLGIPTFFLTFSAADHHWPDLARVLMKTQERLSASTYAVLLN